jgi:hypothetical protein
MPYEPTSPDALRIYMAAAIYRGVLPHSIDQPSQVVIKRTALGAFRIMPSERQDVNSWFLEDLAICLYDGQSELWYVRLQDGVIVRVRDTEDGFVVVPN